MTETPKRRMTSSRIANTVPDGVVIADFTQYAGAVDYVDALLRHEFPAPMVAIVGTDLRSVERVRGRISYASVAIRGAITGSWLGLIYWLFFGGTVSNGSANPTLDTAGLGSAIVIGAGLGMLFGVVRFALNKNRREFLSGSTVVAARYDVVVPNDLVDKARNAMAEHNANCKH